MKTYNPSIFNTSIFFLLMLLCSTDVACQKNSISPDLSDEVQLSALTKVVDKAMLDELRDNHIPGAAVVVVQKGKTVYKKGYGIADVNKNTKVDPDRTVFRIGSISKALTLLTLTKLIDQGKLKIDDALADYVDGIENPYDIDKPITMYNLLTHTTGLDQIGLNRHIYDHHLSVKERVGQRPSLSEFLGNGNLRKVSEPGAYYRYDTYGTTAAGAVIEMITGKEYGRAMQDLLFRPLGMNNSYVGPDLKEENNLAVGHGYIRGDYEVMPYEVYNTMPASSIDATPADMGRLLEALTSDGSNRHGTLFSTEMQEKVMEGLYRPHETMVGMSYGLAESEYIGVMPTAYKLRTLGHGGDMMGFRSNLVVIPSMDIGIYVVANRNRESGGGNVNLWRVVMGAFTEFLGQEYADDVFEIPTSLPPMDLTPYEGDYYYGVHCHSCSEVEYSLGAWRPRSPIQIAGKGDSLKVGRDIFIPVEKNLFVRKDGLEQLYFGIDDEGRVTHFNRTDGLNSFEKLSYPRSLGQGLVEKIEAIGIVEAMEWFDTEKDNPDFLVNHQDLTYTAYDEFNAGHHDVALAILKLVQRNYSHLDEAINTGVIVDITEHLSELKLYDVAHEYADFIIKHYPDSERSWRSKAQIYHEQQAYDKAVEYYRKGAAVNPQPNLFQIAFTEGKPYNATELPQDTLALFETEGSSTLDSVFIYVQGGPMLSLTGRYNDPLSKLPDHHRFLKVYTYQTQMLHPELVVTTPYMNSNQALYEMSQNSEILHRTIKYFKDRGKAVYIIGHSFGLSISMDYLSRYGNEADHVFMMGGHFDADVRNFDRKPGMFVRWKNGEEPYLRDFYRGITDEFPVKDLLNNVFENVDALVHYPRLRRFTALLKDTDLTNVTYVHARFEEASGRSSEEELLFARGQGMNVLESFGDHHSMLSPRYLRSVFNHVLRHKPLRKSLAGSLADKMETQGAAMASDNYIKNMNDAGFLPPHEEENNLLGYYLLGKNRVHDALQVFQLNVKLFPNSWNVYDSLGEAFLALENKEESIKHYKKSLELNPDNQYAIEALRKMEAE